MKKESYEKLLGELYETVMKENDTDYKQGFWDSLAVTCEFCSDEEYEKKETPFHKAIEGSFPKFKPICNTLLTNKKKYFGVIYNRLKNDGFITNKGFCLIN